VSIALAVVAAVPVLLLSTRRSPPPAIAARAEPARSIALTLTGEGGRLRLGWDRKAQPIQAGRCGVLWIADGGILRRVILDASQLRAGTLFYWPVNRDVSFEIKMPEGNDREGGAACGDNATASAQPLERLARPERRARRTASRSRVNSARMARRKSIGQLEEVSGGANTRLESRGASTIAIDEEPQLLAPMPVHALQFQPVSEQMFPKAIVPAPLAAPLLYSTVTVEAVADSRLSRIAGTIPLLRRLLRPPRFLPPRPVRETAPEVPAELARALSGEALLTVRAFVNESGKVTYAEMLSNVTDANRGLASLAVFDARHREFMPAQLGAQMVPGQAILRYRFGISLLASRVNQQ